MMDIALVMVLRLSSGYVKTSKERESGAIRQAMAGLKEELSDEAIVGTLGGVHSSRCYSCPYIPTTVHIQGVNNVPQGSTLGHTLG